MYAVGQWCTSNYENIFRQYLSFLWSTFLEFLNIFKNFILKILGFSYIFYFSSKIYQVLIFNVEFKINKVFCVLFIMWPGSRIVQYSHCNILIFIVHLARPDIHTFKVYYIFSSKIKEKKKQYFSEVYI